MYLPPPGRPVSSPPSFEVVTGTPARRKRRWFKTPDDVRAAIVRDRATGMSQTELASKYDVAQSIVCTILRESGKPVRRKGETKQQYGGRVLAWRLATDPAFRKERGKATSRGLKAFHRKRRAEMEREAYNLNAATNVFRVDPLPLPAEASPVPAPPPTFWQRLFSWVRW